MRWRLVLAVAVAMAGPVAAAARPQQPADPAPTPTGSASILGRVVDATTGAPVDDAVASLQLSLPNGSTIGGGKPQARPLPMLVNDRGQFVFRNLPAGAATIRVTAPGYLDSGSGVRSAGSDVVPINLADAQHLADVTIRMWRFASIEGAVLDESGDPIADVPVRLLRRTVGERRVVPGPTARTDDRGAFRFGSLESGRYLVTVQATTTSTPASVAADYASQTIENVPALRRGPTAGVPHPSVPGFRVGDTLLQPTTTLAEHAPPPGADGRVRIYRTTFYPAAGSLSQADTLEIAAGDERTGVNLTLPLVSTTSVSGVVTDASDLLLELVPADVDEWIGDDGFAVASTMTDDDGAFTFLGVPPGQYLIEGHTNQDWVRAPVTVTDAPVADLSLASRPSLRVTGRYVFLGSRPAPSTSGRGGFAWLAPLRAAGQRKPVTLDAPDGRFAIDNCEPGRYAFQVPLVTAQVPWTVASITAGGKELFAQPFDLESDLSDVVITLTDRPTGIAGAVHVGDEPLDVVAFPTDYDAASDAGVLTLRLAAVAVTAGRFEITGLPPGNYLVAAIPHSEASVWMSHAMREVASQATSVTLTEHARVTVDLKPVVIR